MGSSFGFAARRRWYYASYFTFMGVFLSLKWGEVTGSLNFKGFVQTFVLIVEIIK